MVFDTPGSGAGSNRISSDARRSCENHSRPRSPETLFWLRIDFQITEIVDDVLVMRGSWWV